MNQNAKEKKTSIGDELFRLLINYVNLNSFYFVFCSRLRLKAKLKSTAGVNVSSVHTSNTGKKKIYFVACKIYLSLRQVEKRNSKSLFFSLVNNPVNHSL